MKKTWTSFREEYEQRAMLDSNCLNGVPECPFRRALHRHHVETIRHGAESFTGSLVEML